MSKLQKKAFVGQVTAISIFKDNVFCGIGCNLLVFNCYDGSNILDYTSPNSFTFHEIVVETIKDEILIHLCGEKSYERIRVIENFSKIQTEISIELEDWILSFKSIQFVVVGGISYSDCLIFGMAHGQLIIYSKHGDVLLSCTISEIGLLNCLSFHLTTENQLIVACGTFLNNEILVYIVDKNPTLLYKLIGHKGVAFKLSWSKNGLDLCTGTDDRTIKVWTNVGIVHNKQAITIENSKLTLYGHPGRVLDCKMLSKLLISSGEDGQTRIWDLENGNCITVLQGHKGKFVRVIDVNEDEDILVTGGGDSLVRIWNISDSINNSRGGNLTWAYLHNNINNNNNNTTNKKESIRTIHIKKTNEVIVVTNKNIYNYKCDTMEWEIINSCKYQYTNVLYLDRIECVVMGDIEGNLSVLFNNGNETVINAHKKSIVGIIKLNNDWNDNKNYKFDNTNSFFTTSYDGELHWWYVDLEKQIIKTIAVFKLPDIQDKKEGKQRPRIIYTVALLNHFNLIVGDSDGSLHSFDLFNILNNDDHDNNNDNNNNNNNKYITETEFSKINVHSNDRVTGIIKIDDNIVYSVGRDGNIVEHKIIKINNDNNNSDYKITLEKITSYKTNSKMEMITTIEMIDNNIFIYGFFSSDFIVENFTTKTKIIQINCGGFKRSFDYFQYNSSSDFLFVYTKDNNLAICSSVISNNDNNKIKSKSLYVQSHGLHINTINTISCNDAKWRFITGSEDTTMKYMEYNKITNKMRVIQDMEGHTGGIRTIQIAKHIESKNELLFSAGAFTELKCWKYVGTDNNDYFQYLNQNRKSRIDTHTRIMGIKVWPIQLINQSPVYCILSAQSNGKIKIHNYYETSNKFEVVAIGQYHEGAVLSIDSCIIINENNNNDNGILIFTGSTDGTIHISYLPFNVLPIEYTNLNHNKSNLLDLLSNFSFKNHQCGVNAIQLNFNNKRSFVDNNNNNCTTDKNMIVSAGDDQIISVSTFQIKNLKECKIELKVEHLIKIQACNTAITGLQLYDDLIFTIGSDQRLNIWRIKTDQINNENKLTIMHDNSIFTQVPDVSSLIISPNTIDKSICCIISGYLALQVVNYTY